MTSPKLKFVVENDTFLRLIEVVLDPSAAEERIAAFAHFCLHDLADFRGWCDRIRAQAKNLYPSDVRLVDSQEELLTNLPGATSPSLKNFLSDRKKSPPPARTSDSYKSTASRRATSTKKLVRQPTQKS